MIHNLEITDTSTETENFHAIAIGTSRDASKKKKTLGADLFREGEGVTASKARTSKWVSVKTSFGQNQFQLKHIREIKNGPGQIFKISKL